MKKNKTLFITLFFFFILFSYPNKVNANSLETIDVIINFNGETDYSLLYSYNVDVIHEYKNINSVYATIPKNNINSLSKSIKIHSINENKSIKLNTSKNNELVLTDAEITFYNDNRNYAQDKMNVKSAWDKGILGNGIKVAVVDTGIDVNNNEVKIAKGISFVTETNGDNSIQDYDGHGTNISTLIAGTHSNDFVNGVSPNAQIYIAKALDGTGEGLYSNIIRAIDWAIQQKVHIINLSLGSPIPDTALHNALLSAKNNGIIVVAGAGNNGNSNPNINTVEYPAKYDYAIAVGSTDLNDTRGRFTTNLYSASGSELDFVAPGVYNISLGLNGKYVYSSGTSNSSALVSGLIALYLESNSSISSNNIMDTLQKSSIDLGTPGKDDAFGYGLVQFSTNISSANVANSFSDVDSSHWAYNSINFVKNKKLMVGKDSLSTFKPEDSLTRAEAAALFNRLLNHTSSEGITNPYFDIDSSHWAFNDIVIAFKYSTLTGYEDDSFRPSNTITRAEVASIISRILPKGNLNSTINTFYDVDASHWAYNSIDFALKNYSMTGYTDGSFKPSNNITRAEMASILERISSRLN